MQLQPCEHTYLETGIEWQRSLEHKLLAGGVFIFEYELYSTCKTIINFGGLAHYASAPTTVLSTPRLQALES